MANRVPRIMRTIKGFNVDISVTNHYLHQPSPPPFGINGLRIGWLQSEIDQWQAYLNQWLPLYLKYSNKRTQRTTGVIDELKWIIASTVDFERKNSLYDRIATCPNSIIMDFEVFRVVRGTVLASKTHTRAPAPGSKVMVVVIKKVGHLFHQLLVTSPDHEGRKKEDGVKDIMMFRAVVGADEMDPPLEKYQYIGDVSRGLITSKHSDKDEGKRAWYIAFVKNSRGEIGPPSQPICCLII